MSSPFISFDPFILHSDFLMLLFFVCFFSFPLFKMKNIYFSLQKKMLGGVSELFPKTEFLSSGTLFSLLCLFLILTIINLTSLWSYIFSLTAHISFTFSLGMMIWTSIFINQILVFFFRKMEHFTPVGTPTWLLPLMVIIEVISQLIRPITLSVRLAANLTAGHLILSLLASLTFNQSILSQTPLILLEILVAVVQPFVFCMLLFLYFSEN